MAEILCVFDFVGHEKVGVGGQSMRPSSPWMPFTVLISVLSKMLPPSDIVFIAKFHKEYRVSAFHLLLEFETESLVSHFC